MQIAPLSITNCYNIKQSKTPSFGYKIPEQIKTVEGSHIKQFPFETFIKKILMQKQFMNDQQKSKEYLLALNYFKSEKLDIRGVVNKYLPLFKSFGEEKEFYAFMNQFNAPLKDDGSMDFAQIDLTLKEKHNHYYDGLYVSSKTEDYFIRVGAGNQYLGCHLDSVDNIKLLCQKIESSMNDKIQDKLDEKLKEIEEKHSQIKQAQEEKNWEQTVDSMIENFK